MDENKKVEVVETTIDQKALDAIASGVAAQVAKSVDAKIAEAFEAKAKADEEAAEKTINKNVTVLKEGTEDISNESKEVRLVKAIKALKSHNYGKLAEYNALAEELRTKSGYQNITTDSEGGYVVLDPEFEAAVEKLTERYGVAVNEVTVRRIASDSVKTNKRGSNVTMYEVGEGATITASKFTISQLNATLRKFAGIALETNELTEDQAVDFYNDLVDGFAEESARLQDVQVFTDTNVTYPGITRLGASSGVKAETVGAAITSLTWDDLMNAQFKVATDSATNGKFYMHRTIFNILLQVKDSQGRYQFTPNGSLVTPWGTPIVLVDVLPSSSVVGDANEPYIVFGDLKRSRMYTKNGLTISESMDATVVDADGVTKNLFQQDMKALRVTKREVVLHKWPEAYCLIGTGTVS